MRQRVVCARARGVSWATDAPGRRASSKQFQFMSVHSRHPHERPRSFTCGCWLLSSRGGGTAATVVLPLALTPDDEPGEPEATSDEEQSEPLPLPTMRMDAG